VLYLFFFCYNLELFPQYGISCFRLDLYHTVGTVPKSNRKARDTTPSEEFQNLTENKRYHTVGTVLNYNRKKRDTTLSEQFQHLTERQDMSHSLAFLLDFGTVPTVWYLLFFG
jgi:hypothetical protein